MTDDTDGEFHLEPDDPDLLDRLETLRDFVIDFHASDDMSEDDAVATFLARAGRAQMYRRMREDGIIPAGHNPTLESRLKLPEGDDEIHFYQ